MTAEKGQFNLLSQCCNAPVHGHPESPSGDPTRCSKCGKECDTNVLISYKDYFRMSETIKNWSNYIADIERACKMIIDAGKRSGTCDS